MTTASFDAIADALAARFASGQVTPPAGYANIRSSTADAPNAIGPTPCVVVSFDQTVYVTSNSTRKGAANWFVRFYLDQTGDLERSTTALRKWADALRDQLKGAVQLTTPLVDRAVIESLRLSILTYGGVSYAGIEIAVQTVTTEGWVATA